MKRRAPQFIASLFALSVLLLAGNLIRMASTHSMAPMPSSQCQSSCTFSQTPADVATKPEDILEDKGIEPQPADPYYLIFMGVGWTTAILLATAYLFGYLHWRPPDLYKLNVAYLI